MSTECSAMNRTYRESTDYPASQGSENTVDEEAEGSEEPEYGEGYRTLLFGCEIAVVPANSLQLWFHAQDLPKMGPTSTLS